MKGALPKRETNIELILFWEQGPKIYKAKTRSWTKVTYLRTILYQGYVENIIILHGRINNKYLHITTVVSVFLKILPIKTPIHNAAKVRKAHKRNRRGNVVYYGGFQLEDFIISSVKNHMTCYKFNPHNAQRCDLPGFFPVDLLLP